MTLTQQEKQALTDNWDAAKATVSAQFQGINEGSLGDSPDVARIAKETGRDKAQVEAVLKQAAAQYTSPEA